MPQHHLPPELLDHIADYLHDSKAALRSCCLVSRSWIPRTRKHLFAQIGFYAAKKLRSWKDTFQDPSASPACYTKLLTVGCLEAVTTADAGEGGWIRGFSRVTHFAVGIITRIEDDSKTSLIPFHGFSPALKSLHTSFYLVQSSHIFNLIRSFPLLEDLSVTGFEMFLNLGGEDNLDQWSVSAYQPNQFPLTGSLILSIERGMGPIASRLLSLPGGLHFRELDLMWRRDDDVSFTVALVERCCGTLEFLDINCGSVDGLSLPVDLSKATKLRQVTISCHLNPKWFATALRTIPNRANLEKITLPVNNLFYKELRCASPVNVESLIGQANYTEWLEFDRLLVKFWETHSVRPKVLYAVPSMMSKQGARSCMEALLPEVTARGIVDMVE